MSHIIHVQSNGEVHLKTKGVLMQALKQIQGSEIVTEILDYYGHPREVEFGVKTPNFPRGIGFEQVGDEYQMISDRYGQNTSSMNLMNEITANYQKSAHVSVLIKYGFITSTEVEKNGDILVQGRSY